jgi:hypothetical protein
MSALARQRLLPLHCRCAAAARKSVCSDSLAQTGGPLIISTANPLAFIPEGKCLLHVRDKDDNSAQAALISIDGRVARETLAI